MRAEITTLRAAVAALVADGDTVVIEGFTHLIPQATGHELIRQGKRNLTLIKMTPDLVCDQIIGMGGARRLQFSWGGNPGVGPLYRLRDAVENDWPCPLELSERSHADMATAYEAGAAHLPFGVLRGHRGTDLPKYNPDIQFIRCPFTGEELTAVRSIRADVGLIHAQRADRKGNVQLWGIVGVQKETVLCARRSIVTVEEIVEELEPRPDQCILPNWVVTAVCHEPGGAHPSYALDYYPRDNRFYSAWEPISKERDTFRAWMERHVMATASFAEYRRSVAAAEPATAARASR